MQATHPLLSGEGIAWYAGAPQTGKTTLALKHAGELCIALGWPVLVLDSMGAVQFADQEHQRTNQEVLDRLYGQARGHAIIHPWNAAEVEALMRAVRVGRRVIILIDETAFWFNAQSGRQGEILRLMRGWFHAEVRLLCTTQHLSGDIPQEAWACSPRMYVFRQTAPAAWDLLEHRFRIGRDEVEHLAVGAFLEHPRAIVAAASAPAKKAGEAPKVEPSAAES